MISWVISLKYYVAWKTDYSTFQITQIPSAAKQYSCIRGQPLEDKN